MGYTPVIVVIKYWLNSLCYTMYPCSLFTLYVVVLPLNFPPLYCSFPIPLPMVDTSLYYISVSLFHFEYSTHLFLRFHE